MIFIDHEIKYSEKMKKLHSSWMKQNKIYQWISFILLLYLSISAYYFHYINWTNGFLIGINFMNLFYNFAEQYSNKNEVDFYNARENFYVKLKEAINKE